MPNFCGYCGTSNERGKFCTACGKPLAEPAPVAADEATRIAAPSVPLESVPLESVPLESVPLEPTVDPAPSFVPEPPAPSQQAPVAQPTPSQSNLIGPGYSPQSPPSQPYQQQPYAPQQPYLQQRPVVPRAPWASVPKINPFVGVPLGDYIRDAAALFCLFAALGMPWDAQNDGADRWWVVLATLISITSLALAYVGKARLIPGWTQQHVRLAKSAASVPFLASVIAVVINELVNIGDDFDGGIGTGVAVGTAGAVLALQPRQADEDPAYRDDRAWNLAGHLAAMGAIALGVLAFIAYFLDDLTNDSILTDDILDFVGLVLLFPVLFLVVLGWPAAQMLGGSPAWRRVFATAAFTVLVIALFSLASDGDGLFSTFPYDKWNTPVGGTFLVGAAAALSVSRPQQRLTQPRMEPVMSWIDTASRALMVSGVALALTAVTLVLSMVSTEEFEAPVIVATILVLVSAVAAVFATALLADVRRNRTTVLGLIGGVVLLSIISIAVINSQDIGYPIGGWATAMWFSLPGLAAYSLIAPIEVRTALGPLVTERPAAYPPGAFAPPPQPGGYPMPPQGQPLPPQQGDPQPSGYPNSWSNDQTH